ncbi:MAG: hypothetical protein JW934_18945 [Anaerolineae bacterium]|nr:hypothetical protein [Anaerolineae bacterium]
MAHPVLNLSHDTAHLGGRDCKSVDVGVRSIGEGILKTIEYSDLFDYPLTAQEIHRYLVGVQATLADVQRHLSDKALVPGLLSQRSGYFVLSGRESIVQSRLRRANISANLWRKAVRYGWLIAALPFVRMVAVTGTLAVDNADAGADVDYLIVTEPGRLWLVRSLVIGVVYLGQLERLEICPNYLIAGNALDYFDRSLFTAHELAQMVPLYGLDVYKVLIQVNAWARCFFPNAFGLDDFERRVLTVPSLPKRALERALSGRLGDHWEARVQAVKISQLTAQARAAGSTSAVFTPQLCKGHVDDHGRKIAQRYAERVQGASQGASFDG